jgi:hypothetical protein
MLLFRAVLFLALVNSSFVSAFAQSPITEQSCPPVKELVEKLSQRKESQQKVVAGLQNLLSGKTINDTPPASLFTVDMKDTAAVKRRVTELRGLGQTSPTQRLALDADSLLTCALSKPETHNDGVAIIELQEQADALRLKFLELSKERREAVLRPQVEVAKQTEDIASLKEERNKAIDNKEQAKKSFEIAEQKSLSERTAALRSLAAERAILEKARADLANTQIEAAKYLEEEARASLSAVERLSEFEARLNQGPESERLRQDYRDAVRIWRDLVDRPFGNSSTSTYASDLPELPKLPAPLLKEFSDTRAVLEYKDSYEKARQQRDSVMATGKERFEKNMDLHYRLLLRAGKTRSELLNRLLEMGDRSPTTISGDYLLDLARELKVVPYRWAAIFYVKALDIHHKLTMGFQGLFLLAKEALIFLIFLVIPVVLWLGLRKVTTSMNNFRLWLVDRRRVSSLAGPLAIWLQRLIPYLPWLIVLGALEAGKMLLEQTMFSELTILLPYIRFYSYYRVFRLIIDGGLSSISLQAHITAIRGIQPKLQQSSRTVGLFLLFSLSILHAMESMISHGLVYRITFHAVIFSGLVILAWVAHKWQGELAAVIRHSMAIPANQRLSMALEGRYSLIWCVPGLLVVIAILVLQWLQKWGEQFETYKRTSAIIFRRKLENTTLGREPVSERFLPAAYQQWFSMNVPADASVLISPQNDVLKELADAVDGWANGIREEHSTVIFADKGAGKSCLLFRLAERTKGVKTVIASVPPKLTTRAAVLSFFENVLQGPMQGPSPSATKSGDASVRTLVLIDEAHNLFLSKAGGFEGFTAFLELINAPVGDIFWCAAFNHYAWSYLSSVFGRKPYFSMARKLPSWTDADIRELILTRHDKTAFRLSYDDIISAAGNQEHLGGVSYAESSFFRLLWQQSCGNPRMAIHLWLTSLRSSMPHMLNVGLPDNPDPEIMSAFPEDAHFVYAQIIRHENLSAEEAVLSTNLDGGVVKHALKLGMGSRILDCSSDGRYRVSPVFQDLLINYLSGKNFIYGQ